MGVPPVILDDPRAGPPSHYLRPKILLGCIFAFPHYLLHPASLHRSQIFRDL